MFVEVYRTDLTYDNGLGTNPVAVGIISTNAVVNVDAITSICMVPTVVNDTNFHRVRLNTTADIVETSVGKLYITDRDFERLVH